MKKRITGADDLLEKKVTKIGTGAHITIPKQYIGRRAFVVVMPETIEVEISTKKTVSKQTDDPRIPKKDIKEILKTNAKRNKKFKEHNTKDGYFMR